MQHADAKKIKEKYFLIGIVGGGVKLDQLGTAASNKLTVPTPRFYDREFVGMMIGRGNRNTRRKPARVGWSTTNPKRLPGREPGPP
jgi:hypothetical protein